MSSITFSGMEVLITFSMMSFLRVSRVTFSLCWQDTTTVWTLMGTQAPYSNWYSHTITHHPHQLN